MGEIWGNDGGISGNAWSCARRSHDMNAMEAKRLLAVSMHLGVLMGAHSLMKYSYDGRPQHTCLLHVSG